jgi:hypothetical protein
MDDILSVQAQPSVPSQKSDDEPFGLAWNRAISGAPGRRLLGRYPRARQGKKVPVDLKFYGLPDGVCPRVSETGH